MNEPMEIRRARPGELDPLGQLMVSVYGALEGFPGPDEQPKYYEMLANLGRLAAQPDTELWVAVRSGELLGGVLYLSDMSRYGSGGTATRETEASGFRLLAVAPSGRGLGIGRALAEQCITLARERGHRCVIIHTTQAMKVAWGMYERLGFEAAPELDFLQGNLPVHGFRLRLVR